MFVHSDFSVSLKHPEESRNSPTQKKRQCTAIHHWHIRSGDRLWQAELHLPGFAISKNCFEKIWCECKQTMQIHRGQVSRTFPRQSPWKAGPVSTAYQPLNQCLQTSTGVSDFLGIVFGWTCDYREFKKKKMIIRFKLKFELMLNIQAVTKPDQHC